MYPTSLHIVLCTLHALRFSVLLYFTADLVNLRKLVSQLHVVNYCTLVKEGPWAVHLTLAHDWGMGRYSRYLCRIYM